MSCGCRSWASAGRFAGLNRPWFVPVIEGVSVQGLAIRKVILVPAPAEYVAYNDLRFRVPSNIALVCSSSTVQRGQVVACTASLPAGADSFRVILYLQLLSMKLL